MKQTLFIIDYGLKFNLHNLLLKLTKLTRSILEFDVRLERVFLIHSLIFDHTQEHSQHSDHTAFIFFLVNIFLFVCCDDRAAIEPSNRRRGCLMHSFIASVASKGGEVGF